MVVLLHATANLPLTLLLEPLGSRAMVPFLFLVGLMVVAAIVVVIVAEAPFSQAQEAGGIERESCGAWRRYASLSR